LVRVQKMASIKNSLERVALSLILVLDFLSVSCNKNKEISEKSNLPLAKTSPISNSLSSGGPSLEGLSANQLGEELRKLSGAAFEMASAVLEDPSKRGSLVPEAKRKQGQFDALRKEIERRLRDKEQSVYFHQSGLDEVMSDRLSEGMLDFNYILVPKSNAISPRLRQAVEAKEFKKRNRL